MGFFSSLFGQSKTGASKAQRTQVVASIMAKTNTYYTSEEQLAPLLQELGAGNYGLKVDVLNRLYEEERTLWADALLKKIAEDPAVPNALLKAFVVDVFLAENRLHEFLEPARKVLKEFPSETDLALALGKLELKDKHYQEAVDLMTVPLECSPDSRHLFGLLGEAYNALGKDEEALIHVRASLELYEEAFKIQSIVTDELQAEEFEYTRLYHLLEDIAQRHLGGEKKAKAFESLRYSPEEIGLRKEADRIALMRVEFKPKRLTISDLDELEKLQSQLSDNRESESEAAFLRGSKDLRLRKFPEAIVHFRKALELDMEAHGSYYGWSACGELERVPQVEVAHVANLKGEEHVFASLYSNWTQFSPEEKRLAILSVGPIINLAPQFKQNGSTVSVHPLDVRLKDLYPEPKELNFEPTLKTVAAADAFSDATKANLRIDAFLQVSQKRAPLAYHLGQLAWNVLSSEQRSVVESDFQQWNKTATASVKKNVPTAREFLCFTLVCAVQKALLGSSADDGVVVPGF